MLARPSRDRRGPHLQPATGRAIGLADDEQVVRGLGDARQERHAERAGAEEDDATEATH